MRKIDFTELNKPKRIPEANYLVTQEGNDYTLVLARGECRTGGYDIRLKEVSYGDCKLIATVEFKDPDPGAFVTMAITYPTRTYQLSFDGEIKEVIFQTESNQILKVIHI